MYFTNPVKSRAVSNNFVDRMLMLICDEFRGCFLFVIFWVEFDYTLLNASISAIYEINMARYCLWYLDSHPFNS